MSLKKYKKVKYLGKGSYGAAILVSLKSNPKENFVIKEIVIGHLKESEQQSAKNEVEVLRQMHHSNIAMYVESFVENSKLYIVMEYADGGDLTGAVQRRKKSAQRWDEEEVMRIFVQICLALKHVHDQNILHRDLKSQNIFLTSKGIVKLGDFGIAKILDASGDEARTQIGTPYYLSPEICESKPYGRSSDIWSLGIVLYELLALELPFTAQSLPALVVKICSADPSWTIIEENYSPQILALTRQMVMKNPAKRPTVKDVVRTEFVTGHISRLLSHTIRMGTGGAESAVTHSPAIDPEEVDRTIEKERERQRVEQREKEKNHQVEQMHRERQAKREEEREKLRKFRQERRKERSGSDATEDVVLVPSASVSSVGQTSRAPGRRPSADEEVAAIREQMRQREKQHQMEIYQLQQQQKQADEVRNIYLENQAKARENKQKAGHDATNLSRGRGYGHDEYSGREMAHRGNDSSQFESAARREFFANRAAAQQIKARVEQYEREGGSRAGLRGVQEGGGRNMIGYSDAPLTGEDRIAQVKAQRERERERENSERQRQLQLAYEETRAAKARLQEQRRRQGEPVRRPSGGGGYGDGSRSPTRFDDDSEQSESHIERQRRREKQREEDARQREEALRSVAAENRAQRRAMRKEGRPEAVAFSIDLSEGNDMNPVGGGGAWSDKKTSVSVESTDRGRSNSKESSSEANLNPFRSRDSNSSNWNRSRAQRNVSDGSSTADDDDMTVDWGGNQPPAARRQRGNKDSGRRSRKGWGTPVDPFRPVVNPPQENVGESLGGDEDDAVEVQESATLIRAYGESIAREVEEDEEVVLKAIEAKHGREHQARIQAKEKFRMLKAQQQQGAQSFKKVSQSSTIPEEEKTPDRNQRARRNGSGISSSRPRDGPSARPNLDEILGKVAAANEEVNRAIGVNKGKGPGGKDRAKKSVRTPNSAQKRLELDDSEIFSYSSGSDSDNGVGDSNEKLENDDLVKTLDTWLTRHNDNDKYSDDLSESKIARAEREAAREAQKEESSRLGSGNDESGGENAEDGEMADLQCMLADALMQGDNNDNTVDDDF